MRTIITTAAAIAALTGVAMAEDVAPLGPKDFGSIVSASQENELRFKRDFAGKVFTAVGSLKNVRENMVWKGRWKVEVGDSRRSIYCWFSEEDVAGMADWKRGLRVRITGQVKDTTLGDLELSDCNVVPASK